MTTLPIYGECEAAQEANSITALQFFILNNEPAGLEYCAQFRGELLAVVKELTEKP